MAVLVALGLIVAYFWHGWSASPAASMSPIPPVAVVNTATPSDARTAPEDAKRRERRPVSAALQREYMDAPDLYAFAMQARRRPAEGGLFYALQAWSHCATVQPQYGLNATDRPSAEVATTGTVSARRIEAMERYQRRCGGFRNDDNTIYRALNEEAKQRTDPLWTTTVDLRAADKVGDLDGFIAALKAMLALRDALLVSVNTFWFRRLNSVGAQATGGLWFEGYDYAPAHEEAVYQPALEFAACAPNAPCFADTQVTLWCATGFFCGNDPADVYFHGPNAGPWPPGYEDRVRALAERMRAALDRGDIDAFRAPH